MLVVGNWYVGSWSRLRNVMVIGHIAYLAGGYLVIGNLYVGSWYLVSTEERDLFLILDT
jgi:hypothetical protein